MLYTLYLNFKERIMEYTLPSMGNGRHTVDITHEMSSEECILEFEVIDGVWRMLSNKYIQISTGESGSTELRDDKIINVSVRNTAVSFVVTVSSIDGNVHDFSKYICSDFISVGNDYGCDICISDELVSHRHCVIEKTEQGYVVTDSSTNGIYINSKRADEKTLLSMFDTIYIFGTKIIFLGNVIAVSNTPDVTVSLALHTDEYAPDSKDFSKINYFPENDVQDVSCDEFSVCIGKPQYIENKNISQISVGNIFSAVFPSAAILTAAMAYINKDMGAVGMGMMFLGSSALLSAVTLLASHMQNKNEEKNVKLENSRIREDFIKSSEDIILRKIADYTGYLETRYKSSVNFTDTKNIFRFIKNKNDSDFLKIRIGTGECDISDKIVVSDKSDYDFVKKYCILKNVPVIMELAIHRVIGIVGEKEDVYETASAMAVQISSLVSHEDVKFVTFFNLSESGYFSFMRWFPHSFSDDMCERFTACTDKSYKNVLFNLTEKLSERLRQRKEGYEGRFFPHYVVFCSDNKIFKDEAVQKYINHSENLGVTFILMYHKQSNLPSGCDTIIYITDKIIHYISNDKKIKVDSFESVTSDVASSFAGRLLAACDERKEINQPVPEEISYFDMMSVRNPNDFNIMKNYKINRVDDGISACIGVGANGKRFYLDMHEKKHGPHGLVAGTTGSGKSEALVTLIVSLALRYHPDELAFVLIDYKGGGMSDIFEKLPHTSGVVTNLTESLSSGYDQIRRILISLSSEIKRRQILFKKYGVNHIDTYMKLFRQGKADESCPHIIIIVDEFAELKKERTEFISSLVSTARIGRSLGLHLILATQKPSGVVDDEIWGNSRFRLCLKVQDKSDSMGMLKRPEASKITVVGRACVQVGNDEIFEMIQTGYAGAVYDDLIQEDGIRMIDIDASSSVVRFSPIHTGDLPTQLDMTVRHIIRTCQKNNIPSARKLWCNPLPELILYEDFLQYERSKESRLVCRFGFTDDPHKQDIHPSEVYDTKLSNILVAGNTGSGKTTLMHTILYDIMLNHSPDVLKTEIFDFTNGLFDIFSELPHCRGVHTEISEETLSLFFKNSKAEIDRRRNLFSSVGCTSFSEYTEEKYDVTAEFVFFDGYHVFKEMYPEYEDDFVRITRESAKYGIYFIVTVNHASDMKFRVRNNFDTVIALRQSDRTEYSELFGIRPEFSVPMIPGRGFLMENGKLLEFQAAVCVSENGKKRKHLLKEKTEFIKRKYPLENEIQNEVYTGLQISGFCCDLGKINSSDYFKTVLEISKSTPQVIMWFEKNDIPKEILLQKNIILFKGIDGLCSMLYKLKDEFSARNSRKKECGKHDGEEIVVMINDMDDFLRNIYDEEYKEDMSGITEVFWKNGEGLGITFVSSLDEGSIYKEKEAFMIFRSYRKGKENA
ncbi:MAG: type VII secretion protein EssC [Oscillospiraceae bacterium]|nr:type VII secretion protein EssC [Oscillospiraceae bacterium]